MTTCNVQTFEGRTAPADAKAFIETLTDTKFLGITSWVTANVPGVMVIYKT
jgi:hypothetical protein